MENSELAIFNTSTLPSYSSIKADSKDEKIKLLNAMESCDFVLNDVAPLTMKLKDVYISQYSKTDENGETRTKRRTILFDADGKTYVTTSNYFFFAISKIFGVLGTPDTWSEPLEIEIYRKNLKNGNKSLSAKVKGQ